MELHRMPKLKSGKRKKRIGRGIGSGKGGHTVGRGTKGQKARSKVPYWFEGGQIPLYKNIPQVGGFCSLSDRKVTIVALDKLNALKAGSKITPNLLIEKGILKKAPKGKVKILLKGKFDKKVSLEGFLVSKNVRELIEKLGGEVILP